ncbi:hypothetical protein [Aquibium carbonis]|uniref:hypothetical protein n=1 Tax=Aquibium carbonis TaxID=2495581 RepID=UPI001FDF5411|nr:hypothetical protein [Aquibium carbonis]
MLEATCVAGKEDRDRINLRLAALEIGMRLARNLVSKRFASRQQFRRRQNGIGWPWRGVNAFASDRIGHLTMDRRRRRVDGSAL